MAYSSETKRQESTRKVIGKGRRNDDPGGAVNRAGNRRIEFGKKGESAVIGYLERLNWKIVERNWRAGRFGEVDIIAEDPDDNLVFVEVKTRRSRQVDSNQSHVGFEAVGGLKQQKIVSAALRYLARRGLTESDVRCRFDVVVVHHAINADGAEPEILHVQDAFHGMSWS